MAGIRPAVLMSAVLGIAALVLTLDELSRVQPTYFSWPNAPGVGALVLLALFGAVAWLVRDTRPRRASNMWAKSALALTVSLPLAWYATNDIVWRKLRVVPDGDMPAGLVDRMNADVFQMQVAGLAVTAGVLACIVMTTKKPLGWKQRQRPNLESK